MRMAPPFSLFFLFFTVAGLLADENPFLAVRNRYQWAIEELVEHKNPGAPSFPAVGSGERRKRKPAPLNKTPFQAQSYRFESDTDRAKVVVTVTAREGDFIVDVVSDERIEGWVLKRQSTRQVFLKGDASTDNPYQLKIRVERPYVPDFGLTLFVTEDGDPAFVRLY